MIALFEGGPADGYELGMVTAKMPDYVMLMPSPIPDSMPWIVVGADFDDHWPGQERYERKATILGPNEKDEFEVAGYVYRHAA